MPVAAIVPVLLAGAYHTGTMEGPALLYWYTRMFTQPWLVVSAVFPRQDSRRAHKLVTRSIPTTY